MYYSEHLMNLTKQEKSPVNKMYLSELNMKWKHFQELVGEPETTNEQLVESLSQYLAVLHNRKFSYNKIRSTGFHHNSPVFSPYYIHDLISALLQKQKILQSTGMEWGFNSFNYNFRLTGRFPEQNAENPDIRYLSTPPVLSLTQSLDLQYRVTGKRNFTKKQLKIPYLLFFAFKNPKADHFFMVEHYTAIAMKMSSLVKTFVVSETLSDPKNHLSEELPIKLFGMHSRNKNKSILSLNVTNQLDEAINKALKPIFAESVFKEKQVSKPRENKPRKRTSYKHKKK